MESQRFMKNLFEYIDYRSYLKDLFTAKKQDMPAFSYRYLSHKLGLKSPGFILYVLQGKRKLSEDLATRLATVLRLSRRNSEYFLTLVNYGNAKKADEKQYFFEKMSLLRRKAIKTLDQQQYRFYDKWYYSAIRELISIQPFHGNYRSLADSLMPKITVTQAKEGLRILEELGLIVRDDRGAYSKADQVISTGMTWKSPVIKNLQATFLDLGKESLHTCPKEFRDISNLTISISQATFQHIRRRIENLRSEILSLAASDEQPDSVYQCNFQLFPLFMKSRGKDE